MPNWCMVDIEIVGPTAEMEKLAAVVNSEEDPGFLQTICPNPTGYWDYVWSVENWGTKWDICEASAEVERLDDTKSRLTINTETAWGPPVPALDTYQENNPDTSVRCCYYEPGMDFGGIYEDRQDHCLEHIYEIDWDAPDKIAIELDTKFNISEEPV